MVEHLGGTENKTLQKCCIELPNAQVSDTTAGDSSHTAG